MKISYLLLVMLASFIQGCGVECRYYLRDVLAIDVYDYETGEPLCGVSGYIIGDEYYEDIKSLNVAECTDSEITGAMNQEGLFRVTLFKEGYETWESDDIEMPMRHIACYVGQQVLVVKLKKLEPLG